MPTAGEQLAAMQQQIAALVREIGELKSEHRRETDALKDENLRLWRTIEHMNEVKFPQTLAEALRPTADLRTSMRFTITTVCFVFGAGLGAVVAIGLRLLG